jgi:hypothetical protein
MKFDGFEPADGISEHPIARVSQETERVASAAPFSSRRKAS